MIGHLLGAAGAVEAVAVIEAIQTGAPRIATRETLLKPYVQSMPYSTFETLDQALLPGCLWRALLPFAASISITCHGTMPCSLGKPCQLEVPRTKGAASLWPGHTLSTSITLHINLAPEQERLLHARTCGPQPCSPSQRGRCFDRYWCVLAGWVHPNINLDDPEGDVELEILVGPQKQQVRSCQLSCTLASTCNLPCYRPLSLIAALAYLLATRSMDTAVTLCSQHPMPHSRLEVVRLVCGRDRHGIAHVGRLALPSDSCRDSSSLTCRRLIAK